jgi:hypothetical protein
VFHGLTLSAGYVTHGGDRCLWTLRLQGASLAVANEWQASIDKELHKILQDIRSISFLSPWKMLTLKPDQTIEWTEDEDWENIMRLADVLPGEKA